MERKDVRDGSTGGVGERGGGGEDIGERVGTGRGLGRKGVQMAVGKVIVESWVEK